MQCSEKNFGYIMLKSHTFPLRCRIKYSMFNNILYEILKLNCFHNINFWKKFYINLWFQGCEQQQLGIIWIELFWQPDVSRSPQNQQEQSDQHFQGHLQETEEAGDPVSLSVYLSIMSVKSRDRHCWQGSSGGIYIIL